MYKSKVFSFNLKLYRHLKFYAGNDEDKRLAVYVQKGIDVDGRVREQLIALNLQNNVTTNILTFGGEVINNVISSRLVIICLNARVT